MSFLKEITVSYDSTPIVLLDNSGSTSDRMKVNQKSILANEIRIMANFLKDKSIEECHLIVWNSIAKYHGKMGVEHFANLQLKDTGCTHLENALKCIPEEILNRPKVDIYIVTDGEINGNENDTVKKITELYQKGNIEINIISVEANDSDYLNDNCYAGNNIFELIQKNNMTHMIKLYQCHNNHHFTEGFVNFGNPVIPDGFLPFGKFCFAESDFSQFVTYIDQLDKNMPHNNILKLCHDLSITLYNYIKYKSQHIKTETVNLFCKMFMHTSVKNIFKDLINNEIQNHIIGKSKTFQEYRNERTVNLERANTLLFENVKNVATDTTNFMTFPIKTLSGDLLIIKTNYFCVNQTFYIGNKKFNNGSLAVGNYNLPVLPIIENTVDEPSLRKWINLNYHHKYNCNENGSQIIWLFLTDLISIVNSDNIEPSIKQSFQRMGLIMLKEKRYGTDLTEYQYLLKHKLELPKYVLNKCLKRLANFENITNEMFYIALMASLNDQNLIDAQRQHYNLDNLCQIISDIKVHTLGYRQSEYYELNDQYSFQCYISFEDLSLSGGYCIKPHKLANVVCNHKLMISESIYQKMSETDKYCPVCYTQISSEMYVKVPDLFSMEQTDCNSFEFDDRIYHKTNHKIVTVDPTSTINKHEERQLLELNSLTFDDSSYQLDVPTVIDSLNSQKILIKTSEKFKYVTEIKYPFLKNINMENVCLAGGFCRSILLNQKMKDFDFFFYGLKDEDYVPRFNQLMTQILTNIKTIYDNVKFMMMYKPLFNVFEIVCIKDPNNVINGNFNLEYFDKYKFRSLNLYNKKVIIDPIKGEIKSGDPEFTEKCLEQNLKKEDFRNYFEDDDINGLHMCYRLQFIMSKNENILDILNNFDLFASRVAYTGSQVYFTESSYFAYKYMTNIVNENVYSHMYDNRLSKYLSYGFSIAMPELDISKLKDTLNINTLKLGIHHMDNLNIIIHHDSNLEEKIKDNLKIEKRNKRNNVSLYKSSLFCSLVAICRYVQVNKINYLFTSEVNQIPNDGTFQFYETEDTVYFIDKIASRIINYDWYGNLRKFGAIKKTEMVDYAKIIDLKSHEKMLIYNNVTARGYCSVHKSQMYDSFVFKGPSSKYHLKHFMELYQQYKIMVQILDPKNNSRQFIPFPNWDNCFDKHLHTPFSKRYIYEIIRSDVPSKPYLDIEWIDQEVNVDLETFMANLKLDIMEIFDKNYGVSITEQNILILASHGQNKYSFHIILNIDNGNDIYLFETNRKSEENSSYHLCHLLAQKNSIYSKVIDQRVYTIDREFRVIYSNKDNTTDRPFLPLTQSPNDTNIVSNWKDYLVSHYENDNIRIIKTPKVALPPKQFVRATVIKIN